MCVCVFLPFHILSDTSYNLVYHLLVPHSHCTSCWHCNKPFHEGLSEPALLFISVCCPYILYLLLEMSLLLKYMSGSQDIFLLYYVFCKLNYSIIVICLRNNVNIYCGHFVSLLFFLLLCSVCFSLFLCD